ncbi:MAG: AraC family transcriptional regulator [Pseudomonadota bacterium]
MTKRSSGAQNALLDMVPMDDLFDCLLDTVFFVKDAQGRYVLANNTLATRCRLKHHRELAGKLPSEVLGTALGAGYEAQDRNVILTGERITDRLELHLYPNRQTGWCLTNKFPLRDATGQIIGIAGVSKDLGTPDASAQDVNQIEMVLTYARQNLATPPTVDELAAQAGLTPYQLDRRIRRMFGLSTGQWLLKQRLDLAKAQLIETDNAIVEVAMDAGYSDQSAFSRQFLKTTGLTPTSFRQAYRNSE